jgi:GT2 family glycosyltransferase
VLSRDRGDELLHTLERLRSLPERPPVIVVDNGSADGSPARVADTFPDVRLIALAGNHGAAGRTLGVRAAETEYVAFCDDDSWWEPGSLRRAAELLDAHPNVGLLAARVLVGAEGRLEPACEAMAASPLETAPGLPGPRVLGFVACGAVVRRTAYLQAGGFHARYGVGGEEALLAADMAVGGWQLVYVDEMVAHHHPSAVRDHGGRRAGQVRNDLWFAWLRRSRAGARDHTLAALRDATRDAAARRGIVSALGGVPWVVRERRPVPPRVERELSRLDAARG